MFNLKKATVFFALLATIVLTGCETRRSMGPALPIPSPGLTAPAEEEDRTGVVYEVWFSRGSRGLLFLGTGLLLFKQWSAGLTAYAGAYVGPLIGRAVDLSMGYVAYALALGVALGILYSWYRLKNGAIDDGNVFGDVLELFKRNEYDETHE